jgi:hypothetical protein
VTFYFLKYILVKFSRGLKFHAIKQYLFFMGDFSHYKNLQKKTGERFLVRWKDRYPCLKDNTPTFKFDRHYVYHTAWAARILAKLKPEYHVDISSYIYFSVIVSAFVPIKFYDYRVPNLNLSNLSTGFIDLCNLPFKNKSIKSISCMHVTEHIGLGRYGDTIDPEGDLKAISELKRVLAPQGSLLFVVPIGRPKIMFNAHRIYSYDMIAEYFKELEMKEFNLITQDMLGGGLIANPSKKMVNSQTYGCGCFWFMKKND